MKKAIISLLMAMLCAFASGQSVGINSDGSVPNSSAILDVKSTSGGILIPRMTAEQKNAIVTPASGLLVYQTDDTPGYYYNSGTPGTPAWIPLSTINQNTTGTAANVTGTVAVANGGTGSTTAAGARTSLGATTLGGSMFTLTNPSAITFPQFNANNTVSALTAADFRTAIGAGTGGGTVTSVTGTAPIVSTVGATPVISISAATTSAAGSMSAADKTKLDGIATSANNYAHPTGDGNLHVIATSTTNNGKVLTAGATAGSLSWTTPSTGTVTTVTGTSPIVSSGGTAPAISLGTVGVANGGTGQTTYAVGDLLYASTTTALSKLADIATGNSLISGGVGVAPSWGKIALTTHVSGTLPVANGGTGTATTPTQYGVVYASTTSAYASTAAGTAGYLLKSNGTSAPTWLQTVPVSNGGTGAETLTGYVKGTGTTAMTASATIPAADILGNITGNAANVTGIVAVANGGTGSSTAAAARTALSAAASGANTDIISLGGLTTDITVAQGGTGASTLTGLVKGNGTGAFTAAVKGTDYSMVIEVIDEYTATASQTSFTLTQTPSTMSKLKMFVNGIRISKTAFTQSGTTLTYVPANNGAYALTAGDRIQVDYYY